MHLERSNECYEPGKIPSYLEEDSCEKVALALGEAGIETELIYHIDAKGEVVTTLVGKLK